jgi:putative mRNA 3-end processing factor
MNGTKGPVVTYKKGIYVRDGDREVVLDPSRKAENSIVSHAHMDHLVSGSLMTHQTRDIMEVRLNSTDAHVVDYHEEIEYGGFDVVMRESGHCLGSAMVHIKGPDTDLLYTGDFNPHGGLTVPPPANHDCRTLVIEATYGKHTLPPKDQVIKDMVAWAKSEVERSPIVFGGYEFGKAQEIIAAIKDLGFPVYSTENVKRICEVYTKHGIPLSCEVLEEGEGLPDGNFFMVLPGGALRHPHSDMVKELRRKGARVAYVSGWCGVYNFSRSRGVDAQFPVSDHGDLPSLIKYIEACQPEEVLTVFGSPGPLAISVEERLGIPARPLKASKK